MTLFLDIERLRPEAMAPLSISSCFTFLQKSFCLHFSSIDNQQFSDSKAAATVLIYLFTYLFTPSLTLTPPGRAKKKKKRIYGEETLGGVPFPRFTVSITLPPAETICTARLIKITLLPLPPPCQPILRGSQPGGCCSTHPTFFFVCFFFFWPKISQN